MTFLSAHRISLALLLLLLTLAVNAQVQSGAYRVMLKKLLSHTVPEMQVQQLATDTSHAWLLDARKQREYEVSHLDKAVWVGYDHFQVSTLPDSIRKDQPIVVYCSVGYRSEKVAEKLIAAGYTRVSNLYGGIFEWVNQGHTVHDQQGITQRVHAYDRTWGIWLRKGKKVYR